MITAIETKQCGHCHKIKPVDEFNWNKTMKDKLACWCKQCYKAYRQKHRIRIAKFNRKYHQKHKTERTEYRQAYYKTIKGYLHYRFQSLWARCSNPKHKQYKDYGGRGIKCLISFDEFYRHITVTLGYNTYDKIKGLEIDRKNVNKHYTLDNIRIATQSQQNMNKRKQQICRGQACLSKYKGVSYNRQNQKWIASITKDSKYHYLGYFFNEIDAALAYDRKAIELFGEFACTNAMLGFYD